MVNVIRFLERVEALWDGMARFNFMEAKGFTGWDNQSGEIDYTN